MLCAVLVEEELGVAVDRAGDLARACWKDSTVLDWATLGSLTLLEALALSGFQRVKTIALLGRLGSILGDALLLIMLNDPIECLRAALNTEIQHANGVFEIECSRNSHEIDTNGEFIDSDERNDFAACADNEVGWPWLDVVGGSVVRIRCHVVRPV